MEAFASSYSRLVLGLCILAAAMFLSAMEPASAEPSYAEWFRYDEEVTKTWSFTEVKDDPYRVAILRKDIIPSKTRRRVFVFYPRPSSAYDTAISSILNVFEEKNIDAEFSVFNFRKNAERGKIGLALASEWKAELIFSMGSESTAWLWNNYSGGDIPVVSVCSKDPVILGQTPDYERGTGTNFAFTSLNMPVKWQMAYIFELKPDLKNLGVLVNSRNVSAVETQAKPIAEFLRPLGIQVLM